MCDRASGVNGVQPTVVSGRLPIIVLGDYLTAVDATWMAPFRFLLLGWTAVSTSSVENNPSLDALSPGNSFLAGLSIAGGEIEKDLEKYLQKHHPRSRLIFRDECSRRFHFINKKTSIQVVTRRMNESTRENDILNKFRPTIFHFLSFNLT